MVVVRVSALARRGGAPRGSVRADVCVPKPFTPRQIADGVRTALARRAARPRVLAPVPTASAPAPGSSVGALSA
jgi:hypothetical protein